MRLVFKSKHLSINKFNPVDLPDLTIITGVNGAGKTHLLDAIKDGHIVIEGLEDEKPIYFDYRNFYLEDEAPFNAYQIASERESAWSYFLQQLKTNIENHKNQLGTDYQLILELCINKSKKILSLYKRDFENVAIYEKYKNFKTSIKNLFEKQPNFKDNQQAKSIYVLFKKLSFSIDEIEEEEFIDKYRQYSFKNDFLPMQLGKRIWDYYVKWDDNEYNKYENEKKNKSHKILTEEEFLKENGEKPWEVIDKILKKFNSVKYRVNNPEQPKLSRDYNYKLQLLNLSENPVEINFSNLSSGEKVLMALVASIYKSSSDNYFPKLLLLDEIDASLHPSMIKNMLETIDEIFLSKGTKVILVTHSPTTVALAPEESIFFMMKDGEDRIQKKDKKEALSLLTDGFATLDEGLSLLDQISRKEITIITEGYNIDILKKVIEMHGLENVEIINDIVEKSGKNQLKTLQDFFTKVQHKNKVLFVYDCDVKCSLEEKNNTYFYVIPKNESNLIAENGIENSFSKEMMNGFTKTITLSDGRSTIQFDENRKRDFAEFIIKQTDQNQFLHFSTLVEKIKSISNC